MKAPNFTVFVLLAFGVAHIISWERKYSYNFNWNDILIIIVLRQNTI